MFANQTNVTMISVSSGIQSRSAVFRTINNQTVPLLNLQITLTQGVISDLQWDNSCYGGKVCSTELCVDTSVFGS